LPGGSTLGHNVARKTAKPVLAADIPIQRDRVVAMLRKIAYIQSDDELSSSPRFSPPAPIPDWMSGLGCCVIQIH
jgi:hypothetical protein